MTELESYARVLHLISQARESLEDRLTTRVLENVPHYEAMDRASLRQSVAGFLGTLLQTLETGDDTAFLNHANAISNQRVAQGVMVGDFLKALQVVYAVFRELLREVGPAQDKSIAEGFRVLEARIQHLNAVVTGLYVANLQRALKEKGTALNRMVQELESRNAALGIQMGAQTRQLHSSKEFNARVIDSLTSGVAVITPEQIVTLFSHRMEEILEIPVEEALRANINALARQVEGMDLENMVLQVRQTGRLPMTKRVFKLRSGRERTVFMQAHRLYDDAGEVEGTVVIMDDVSERELLLDSFSRYVSKDVVNRLLARGRHPGLEAERRFCTIFFADIRGFTSLAEHSPPEQLHEMLNTYFRIMVEAVTDHGGFIDKFVGDKIMALFQGNDRAVAAASAVRAADALLRKMASVASDRAAAGRSPIEVGVGINSGEVLLGNVGAEARMDFTAIGDVVNVADRLQSLAPGGSVMVGEATVNLVAPLFTFEGVEEVGVKGRKEKVRAARMVRS